MKKKEFTSQEKDAIDFYINKSNISGIGVHEPSKNLVELDYNDFLKLMIDYAESKCKETAKNVRHAAAEIVVRSTEKTNTKIHSEIMNISFDDVNPL